MSNSTTNSDTPAISTGARSPAAPGWETPRHSRGRLCYLAAGSLARTQVFGYLLVGVGTVVLLVHLPALSARATFHDDTAYVIENPLVQNPSWHGVQRFFTEVWRPSTVRGYYQPLTMVSLMLDRLVSGPNESMRAYRCTSLALHVANTTLVAVFLYSLFGRAIVAAALALLFGLHPITVESVCWIAERKTVLASFFALWSLIAYVRFTRERKNRFYIACLLMYLLALLSKPITVPLPAMMLLLDHWPLARLGRRSVVEKVPLFALAAVFAVITYVSQSRTTTVYLPGDYNPWQVPLILCHNIIFYLSKALYPVHLSAHYGYMTRSALLAGVIGTALLLPVLVVSHRWTRALVTGWLIFFVMVLPAMGIISVTPVTAANRYLYLPALGFVLIAAWLLNHAADWLAARARAGISVALATALVAVGTAESLATRAYAAHWRDTISLHEYLLTITPRSAILRSDLGTALAATGRTAEAIDQYRQAVRIDPQYALAHFNLGTELAKSPHSLDVAIEQYQEALKIDPVFLNAHLNLVGALLARGRLQEAVTHAEKTVQLKPEHVLAQYNLGKVLLLADRADEGLRHLERAVRLDASFTLGMRDLAWTLATHPDTSIRNAEEAVTSAERALAITQGRDVRVLDVLAAAYVSNGRYRQAVETAEKALTLAKRRRDYELAAEIEERLQLYQWGCPYYENPRVQLERLVAKTNQAAAATRQAVSESQRTMADDRREVQDANEAVATK